MRGECKGAPSAGFSSIDTGFLIYSPNSRFIGRSPVSSHTTTTTTQNEDVWLADDLTGAKQKNACSRQGRFDAGMRIRAG